MKGGPTVKAILDSVVLDENLVPVEPGSGVVGKVARKGNIPLEYYKDPEKTALTFVTAPDGTRYSIPGDFASLEADGTITLLGRGSVSINSGGEKIFPEEVEGAVQSPPRGVRLRRGRRARRALGLTRRGGDRSRATGTTPTLESIQEHVPRAHRRLQGAPRDPPRRPHRAVAVGQARLPVGDARRARRGLVVAPERRPNARSVPCHSIPRSSRSSTRSAQAPPPPDEPGRSGSRRCARAWTIFFTRRRAVHRSRCTRSTTSSPTARTDRSRSAGTSRPTNRGLPAVVFLHGGGFVCGDVAVYDTVARRLAKESGATVFSVDYRLAPEHPFPIPLDDCHAALHVGRRQRGRAGRRRHARAPSPATARAATSSRRDRAAGRVEGPALRAQVLIYPVIDPSCDTTSMVDNATGYLLTADSMREMWDFYVGPGGEPERHVRSPSTRPPTSAGSRPRSSSPPSSTPCATRASTTPRSSTPPTSTRRSFATTA